MLVSDVLVRQITKDDSDALFSLRNNPAIYERCFSRSPVSKEEHAEWFATVLASDDVVILVAEIDSTPVGVLRFNIQADQACISIMVDPTCQGKGLGKQLLREGEHCLRKYGRVKKLVAEVLPDNETSCQLFLKSDFCLTSKIFEKIL